MRTRRRLSDLFVRGKEVKIEDDLGEPVVIWLQKLNAVDREACLRRSNAAKARYMTGADEVEGDSYQAIYAQARSGVDHASLVAIIVAEEITKARARIEAELLADRDGWGKDNYLQGLADSWIGDDDNPGLAATFAREPDDPEALSVKAELDRYEGEVMERAKHEEERLAADWDHASDEDVWHRATRRILDSRANDVFFREFERQELFYSVRDPADHSKRYFGSLAELNDLDDKVLDQLKTAYNALVVDPSEGKDSRRSRRSSKSSDPSSEVDTPPDSGPEDATESKTSPVTSSSPSPTPQPSSDGSST